MSFIVGIIVALGIMAIICLIAKIVADIRLMIIERAFEETSDNEIPKR